MPLKFTNFTNQWRIFWRDLQFSFLNFHLLPPWVVVFSFSFCLIAEILNSIKMGKKNRAKGGGQSATRKEQAAANRQKEVQKLIVEVLESE